MFRLAIVGSNLSSIMYLGLANMLMWQTIKEEREGSSNIGRYHNIINVMLLCVMHGKMRPSMILLYDTMHYRCSIIH